MLTHHRFLNYSGAGLLNENTRCRPENLNWLLNQDGASSNKSLPPAGEIKPAELRNLLLGYPVNMNSPPEGFFAWRRQLREMGIGDYAYNNVGDPYNDRSPPYSTHDFERELIVRFGKLLAFPPDDTWGFLSNSGTDSNMHGMYMGRTLLKGRTGVLPKAYFTKEVHYSVQILRDMLGLEAVIVETLPDGGMDSDDLRQKLADNRTHPVLVIATIGTTFNGAIDQIDRVQEALIGYTSYLHLDAALFGGYLPFTSHAGEVSYQSRNNSKTGRYDSIAVSCHKFFGFPSPAGLFITTKSQFEEFNELFSQLHNPEYIHQVPGTISCSRDAVKPAEFYFYSTPFAQAKLAEDAVSMLKNTAYLMDQMQTHFSHLQAKRANDLSNTISFKKPCEQTVRKYLLATMQIEENHQKNEYAHVVVMPHANRKILTDFLTDLEKGAIQHL